ncbi:MAG: HAD family hydrolase [Pseudomonadota bacterium]
MSSFTDVRCVVFDLDDTLWPCEPTILNAENALYEWLGDNYSKITNRYSLQEIRNHRQEYAVRNKNISHDVTALRLGSLEELALQFAYPKSMAHEGLALFRRYRNKVVFYDDSLSTISALSKKFQIGAISNGNADIEAIGASHYFDFFITAEQAGAAKPDIEIFEYAQQKTSFSYDQLLYVGDHPSIDIVGANQSGWRSIWFNPNQNPWPELGTEPDAQIQKLSELLNLL